MRLLFIHGGGDGAYAVDAAIVSALCDELGKTFTIEYPRIDGLERIDWRAAHVDLAERLRDISEPSIVVAHSIGAAAMIKLLSNGMSSSVKHLFLLAPPYKAADSHWGIDDFTFPDDFAARLQNGTAIAIYHSDDDAVIPVRDALDYRDSLPSAKVSLLTGCGHQFTGCVGVVATDILAAIGR